LKLAERAFHIFKTCEVKLINANRVILKLNSDRVYHKYNFAAVMEGMRALLINFIFFWGYLYPLVIIEKLFQERVEADLLKLLGYGFLQEHIILAYFTLALELNGLLI
jgi:hypothetical protein